MLMMLEAVLAFGLLPKVEVLETVPCAEVAADCSAVVGACAAP